MHPDDGYKAFLTIYEQYKDQLDIFNEADTRAKIIDFILRGSLGWEEKSMRREDNVASGRTDYQLLYENICLLVIEAKKAGDYFDIPKTVPRCLRWVA